MTGDLCLFAPRSDQALAIAVGERLNVKIGAHEEIVFPDREQKLRVLEPVDCRDLYVLSSLYSANEASVHDKLCRLLFFLGALRDAGAGRLTAVVPYLCYAREDRRTAPGDPLTTRYLAQLLEAAGADRVIAIDVHEPAAYENAFRIPSRNIECTSLFADHFGALVSEREFVVVAPDAGGIKRAARFGGELEQRLSRWIGLAFVEKHRRAGTIVGEAFAGDVAGRSALIVDDLVATGETLAHAASSCRAHGASAVYAVVTHALLPSNVKRTLGGSVLDGLVVTNTIAPRDPRALGIDTRVVVLDVAPLLADAIGQMHRAGSP